MPSPAKVCAVPALDAEKPGSNFWRESTRHCAALRANLCTLYRQRAQMLVFSQQKKKHRDDSDDEDRGVGSEVEDVSNDSGGLVLHLTNELASVVVICFSCFHRRGAGHS